MKGKTKKLDIRLTPELDAWISSKATERTISKSSYTRMVLEEIRKKEEQIETSAAQPKPTHIRAHEKAVGISSNKPTQYPSLLDGDSTWHELPMIAIAAGGVQQCDEDAFRVRRDYGAGYYAVKVCGDSMEPDIEDGSVLIMRHKDSLRSAYPKKGEIYDIEINGERTLKRYNTRPAKKEEIEDPNCDYLYESNGKSYRVRILESINKQYEEIIIKSEQEPKLRGWYDPSNQPKS